MAPRALIEHGVEGERDLLLFRSDAETRRRLEAIIAAEARCCAFLDLFLEEQGDELVLSVSDREDGQPVADELAAAFAGDFDLNAERSSGRGPLLGALASA